MASEKRCLYEVLGLQKDCTADEIRSAYKRLALQRHPDKLVQSGLSQAEATAQFQELAQAYEVLSDPKERAWYDSHRSQIIFSGLNSSSNSVPNSIIPNLFSYFSTSVFSGYSDSGKGFYKVYADLFNRTYLNEINFVKKLGLGLDSVREAPIMGNLDSPYEQVTAFYNYWLRFTTVMDFCWVDQYDVMAGPNRKSRRVIEEENKKLRKKARREYNDTVRSLAQFVKKRDKRVIYMAAKRNAEMERKKEEERERKKKMEKERLERASAYEEPEWARVEEEDDGLEEFEGDSDKKENEDKELYCVVCGKKFKNEKQWKNHEQSKKHRKKLADLRESFADEDEESEEEREEEGIMDEFEETSENVDELRERFREGLEMGDDIEENEDRIDQRTDEEDRFIDEEGNDEDDELGVLEAMVSGHKSRKKDMDSKYEDEIVQTQDGIENVNDELDFMEYNNRKSTRKNRGSKKERVKRNSGVATKSDVDGTKEQNKETEGNEDRKERGQNNREAAVNHDVNERKCQKQETEGNGNSHFTESSFHSPMDNESFDKRTDNHSGRNHKATEQSLGRKEARKKDMDAKSKGSSKGKKVKGSSKNSSNMCDRCGEEFESRNKLHKHLADSGHASLKFR